MLLKIQNTVSLIQYSFIALYWSHLWFFPINFNNLVICFYLENQSMAYNLFVYVMYTFYVPCTVMNIWDGMGFLSYTTTDKKIL